MSNFSVSQNKKDLSIEIVEFRYLYFKDDEEENFIFLEGDEPEETLKKAYVGQVYLNESG